MVDLLEGVIKEFWSFGATLKMYKQKDLGAIDLLVNFISSISTNNVASKPRFLNCCL